MDFDIATCRKLIQALAISINKSTKMLFRRMVIVAMICVLTACVTAQSMSSSRRSVEVYRPDGSRQCEPESGVSLEEMQQTLTNAGIQVLSSRDGHDCSFRPALCGSASGAINIFEIAAEQLNAAEALGFIPYENLQKRCGAR